MPPVSRRTFLTTSAAAVLATPALAAEPYQIPDHHRARIVNITNDIVGKEVHVDPGTFALYLTLGNGKAIRYPVGIGKEGRYVPGSFDMARTREWPSWAPTRAMIRREPHIYGKYVGGIPGGPHSPLGARALYLYRDGRDSYLRIHGTPRPQKVGQRVSNGCVRMINEHVIQLAALTPPGTKVVLHPI